MPKKKKQRAESDYMALAHAGTAQSVKSLEQMIATEKDEELKEQLKLALEESRFFYLEPKNATEEKDWHLGKMIYERNHRVDDLSLRIEEKKAAVEKLKLEQSVHAQVLKKHPKHKEDWKYNFMSDFVGMERHKLAELEDEEEYVEAWIETAKQMLKTKKYLEAPAIYWEHVHSDYEDCEDECAGEVEASACDYLNCN